MAETLADLFSGIVTSRIQWTRVDAQEIGSVTNKKIASTVYQIGDGTGEAAANIVYAETRTIEATGLDTIDCAALTQQTLEVPVPFAFTKIRVLRVVNNETAAGKYLYFGANPNDPFNVFSFAIGPGSELLSVNHIDGWLVNETNSVFHVSNPNAAALSYSIVLIGS